MSERAKRIEAVLMQVFSPSELRVEDESWKHAEHAAAKASGGGHFIVYITAPAFAGQSRVACHRLINQALREEFVSNIHALSIHAKA
ncbi:MAG: BolA family protein [Mariprofundaceae bacterium]|nr:BolA family protein [Mariprofundaceae bacterium]